MRIAYVAYWNLDAPDGVARKIVSQVGHWRAAGHQVETFAIRPAAVRARLHATGDVVRRIAAEPPDLAYVRYDVFLPPAQRLASIAPLVVELNGDDRTELRRRGLVPRLANEWSRRALLGRATGIVCVTRELAQRVGPSGRSVAVVANGADPDRVHWTPAPRNERPRAIFLGSPGMVWHGLDRLLDVARALPAIDFDVVGPRVSGTANVHAHGVLPEARYRELLARADVAFGSLALDRAGLTEGCPLKVREYLLAGIPTVIGFRDTDFPEEPWFLLRKFDPGAVSAFVERVRGRRVQREEVAHLFVSAKERERLAFLESVMTS